MLHLVASTCVFVSGLIHADALMEMPARLAARHVYMPPQLNDTNDSNGFPGFDFLQETETGGIHDPLQEQTPETELPDTAEPVTAIRVLNAQVHNFQSQLTAMQRGDAALLARQKFEYENQLARVQTEVSNMEAVNVREMNATNEMRKVNMALRKKASMIKAANDQLRLELVQVQTSMSDAMEFVQQALNASDILSNASEIDVVNELEIQEKKIQQRLVHVKRVGSIGMLQLESNRRMPQSNKNMVEAMFATLDVYKKQKEVREDSLKVAFEAKFKAVTERVHALQNAHKMLHNAYKKEQELQRKLVAAIQHLEKAHERLLRWKHSLINYLHNVSVSSHPSKQ